MKYIIFTVIIMLSGCSYDEKNDKIIDNNKIKNIYEVENSTEVSLNSTFKNENILQSKSEDMSRYKKLDTKKYDDNGNEIIDIKYIHTCYSNIYDDIESLENDSEIVIKGNIINMIPRLEAGSIITEYTVKIEDVRNGYYENKKINVSNIGGTMSYLDYLKSQSSYDIKIQSSEQFKNEVVYAESNPNAIIKEIEDGTTEINMGDNVILFLQYNGLGQYVITGGSYQGKFTYDKEKSHYIRDFDNLTIKN